MTVGILLFYALLEQFFCCGKCHRRLELSIGQLRQTVGIARDTDERLYPVVPWCQLGIAQWPVYALSISLVGSKIFVAPAVDLARPEYRAPAQTTGSNPVKRGIRILQIWVLVVVDKKVFGGLAKGVGGALDRVVALMVLAISESAKRQIPDRYMLSRIAASVLCVPAALDHGDPQPGLG